MLDMKEKEEFLDVIETVNDDEAILHDWLLDELEKHKERCQRDYAMKQGWLEGIKQGREQGRENKNKEIIMNKLSMNMDYNVISKVTGKTINEIIEISNEIIEISNEI